MSGLEFSGDGFREMHARLSSLADGDGFVWGTVLGPNEEIRRAVYSAQQEPPTITEVEFARDLPISTEVTHISLGEDGAPRVGAACCDLVRLPGPRALFELAVGSVELQMATVEGLPETYFGDVSANLDTLTPGQW